jgi:hypothetical protein
MVKNDSDSLFHCVERDYLEVQSIDRRLNDYEGYRLVKEDKKLNLKMYMIREEGQRLVSIKFDVQRIKIPIFNLLCMVYETELYELWFPFCKKSFDVSGES